MTDGYYKCYLAGPIAGLSHAETCAWRSEALNLLPNSIECFSPMRGKKFLRGETSISSGSYDHPLASTHGIIGRDHNDVKTADAVLMNLLGAKRVSIGSVIEAAWCYAYRVPLVLVMEADGSNVHEHVMLTEIPIYRAASLAEGCSLVYHLLLP